MNVTETENKTETTTKKKFPLWGKVLLIVAVVLAALAGLAIGTLCLVLFGQQRFMLPALLGVSGLLVFMQAGGRSHESE